MNTFSRGKASLMVLTRTRSRKFLFFSILSVALLFILFYSGSDLSSRTYVQIHPEDSSEGPPLLKEHLSFSPTKKSKTDRKVSGNLFVSEKVIDIKLPDEVHTFLSTCSKTGIQAILIEPCLLAQTVDQEAKELLKTRKIIPELGYNCKISKDKKTIYSFAIHENHAKFLPLLAVHGQKVKRETVDMSDVTHVFALSNSVIVHILVLFQRSTFWYVKPVETNQALEYKIERDELTYGQSPQAFDAFDVEQFKVPASNLQLATMNEPTVIIPKNVSLFLFQYKFSSFIECNKELAAQTKLVRKERNETDDDKIGDKMKGSMQVLKLLEKNLLVPLWFDGGSLLGWNRECGVLPFDHDIDVITYLHLMNNSYDLIEQMAKMVNMPWAVEEIFGFPWDALQVRLWNFVTRWGFDIFFAYHDVDQADDGHWIAGYHPSPFKSFCKLSYPREAFEEICSAELHGQLIHVPCKPDLVHDAEYGPTWRNPSKEFIINNGLCSDYYTPEESPDSYQCLGLNKDLHKIKRNKIVTHEDRTKNELTENFLNLGQYYFRFCQNLKISGWIMIDVKDYNWPN